MTSQTDDAIRRMLKKTLNMASQTNGFFSLWVGAHKLIKNAVFSPHSVSLVLQAPWAKRAVYKNTQEEDFKNSISSSCQV